MAILARPRCERRMDSIFEVFWILRGMGLMAIPTIHYRGIDEEMGFAKGTPLGIMALNAEGLNLLGQQRSFGRRMGLVAPLAVSSSRGMGLLLFHLCFQIFMARQAQIRTLRQEEGIQFCLVRVVALGALRRGHGHVFTLGTLDASLKVRMAGEAEGAHLVGSHSLDVASVGIVAGQAHPFREGIVV